MDEKQTTDTGHSHAHEPEGCFVCQVARPFLRNLWSDATANHFRNSRVEFLKGVRSLIDNRIERLSRHDEPRGQHVTVE
jgi:hypothetical protein